MKPIGYDAGGIHQTVNSFQDGFEVVLFRLAPHDKVECGIDILSSFVISIHVLIVLCAIQLQPECPYIAGIFL